VFKVTLFSIFFLFFSDLKAQENCQIKKDKDGIKVYLCETEDSPFKTIKVDFEAKTTLKHYAAGILDIDNYKEWQYSVLDVYTLTQISNNELIYYGEIETPWPLSHRDVVFNLKISQNSNTKTLTITLKQLPNYIPHKTGIVRVPSAESKLTVTPIDELHVKVRYILQIDPGGDVPAFLANLFAAQTPWQTFYNYRSRLETSKFSQIEVPFVSNY